MFSVWSSKCPLQNIDGVQLWLFFGGIHVFIEGVGPKPEKNGVAPQFFAKKSFRKDCFSQLQNVRIFVFRFSKVVAFLAFRKFKMFAFRLFAFQNFSHFCLVAFSKYSQLNYSQANSIHFNFISDQTHDNILMDILYLG